MSAWDYEVKELNRTGMERVFRLGFDSTVAFVAIHRWIDGTSFGGIRVKPYPDEEAAERDAHALATAMTRKTMVCGIAGGGAKTVVIEPPAHARRDVMKGVGRFVQSLNGAYYCGGDFGFTTEDLSDVRTQTGFVACGDLADFSARSVVDCLMATGEPKEVIVQGLGAIGRGVMTRLAAKGVRVLGSDLRPEVEGASLDPSQVLKTPCDVFSPCAIGGVINRTLAETIPCRVICGGANNPLESEDLAEVLYQRDVLYVPDFIANAGATAAGASRALGQDDKIESRLRALPELVGRLLDQSKVEKRAPLSLALSFVEERLRSHPMS